VSNRPVELENILFGRMDEKWTVNRVVVILKEFCPHQKACLESKFE